MNQVILLNTKGTSNKFWSYELNNDHSVTFRWGRMGTGGRTERKSFESDLEASNFANQKLQEKFRKGYKEITEDEFELEFIRATAIGSNYKITELNLIKPVDMNDPAWITGWWKVVTEEEASDPEYKPIILCSVVPTGSDTEHTIVLAEDIFSTKIRAAAQTCALNHNEFDVYLLTEFELITRDSSSILQALRDRMGPVIGTLFNDKD